MAPVQYDVQDEKSYFAIAISWESSFFGMLCLHGTSAVIAGVKPGHDMVFSVIPETYGS
jgi:hypothetical protein